MADREGESKESKLPSGRNAWGNFDSKNFGVMRTSYRANHPTRAFMYHVITKEFGKRHFRWLDIGTVGMVDYERLVDNLDFEYTGVDISPAILEDSRRWIRKDEDRLVLWNVEDPITNASARLEPMFDLVTARHVLNHCNYYQKPLNNMSSLLKPGGLCIVILHLCLIEEDDRLHRHRDWSVEGEVIGNYYNREKLLGYFRGLLKLEHWVRFDDGIKPNDVLIGRKPVTGQLLQQASKAAQCKMKVVRFGPSYSRTSRALSKMATYSSCGILGTGLRAKLKRVWKTFSARALVRG